MLVLTPARYVSALVTCSALHCCATSICAHQLRCIVVLLDLSVHILQHPILHFIWHLLQVVITKLKIDKDRKALLDRKQGSKDADKGKGKFTEKEVQAMQDVD